MYYEEYFMLFSKGMGSHNLIKQQIEEKDIFLKFAKVASLSVTPGTLSQPKPPKPDIYCEINGRGKMAFELMELEDQDSKAFFNNQFEIHFMLEKEYGKLPESHPLKEQRTLNNRHISICIKDSVSINKVKGAIQDFWGIFKNLHSDYEGSIDISQNNSLSRIFSEIEVSRPEIINGPIFHLDIVTWVGDPPDEKVTKKLSKNYETGRPLELILYLNQYAMFENYYWIKKFETIICDEIKHSQFSSCWLFNFNNDGNILFHLKAL